MPELQTIPARHGVATYVPAGQVIKIINSSGSQVVDTWAFALPKTEPKGEKQEEGGKEDGKSEQKDESKSEEKENEKPTPAKKGKKGGNDLPTQEEAEKATRDGLSASENAAKDAGKGGQQKSTWSSYVPSLGFGGKGGQQTQEQKDEQKKNSKSWASYFPSGQGFSNYVPKSASNTVSSFASSHARDPNKSYMEQLQDFSKTPVGAAGIKAFSGSGYGGSLYAGYQAYNATHANDAPPMEFMSMPHTRAASLHMRPKVNDVLVSNLREPMLTVVEDTSPGIHDTLVAACDPYRYRQLGADKWEEHGSCAENLVLALKELNERAGLKGAKGIGADVTINNVPAPLNLFMNIPWDEEGDIGFKAPKTKEGDYIRLKAERDVVLVMSACPQDILEINNKKPTDANFIVEGDENSGDAVKRTQQTPRKRPPPRKINSSAKPPSTVATGDMGDDDKSNVGSTPAKKAPPKRAPVKKPAPSQPNGAAKTTAPAKKKPVPRPAGTPAKAAGNATAGAEKGDGTNGSAAPVEKKKPRKLVRPTPAADKAE